MLGCVCRNPAAWPDSIVKKFADLQDLHLHNCTTNLLMYSRTSDGEHGLYSCVRLYQDDGSQLVAEQLHNSCIT